MSAETLSQTIVQLRFSLRSKVGAALLAIPVCLATAAAAYSRTPSFPESNITRGGPPPVSPRALILYPVAARRVYHPGALRAWDRPHSGRLSPGGALTDVSAARRLAHECLHGRREIFKAITKPK
jgi:hypothetical protein